MNYVTVCVCLTHLWADMNRLETGDTELGAWLSLGYLRSGLHHGPLLR